MRSNARKWYPAVLVGADALLLYGSFAITRLLLGPADLRPAVTEFALAENADVGITLVALGLTALLLCRAYSRSRLFLGGPDEYACVVGACTYAVLLLPSARQVYGAAPPVSTGWLVLLWACSTILVCTGRFILRRVVYRLRRRGWFVSRALIAGASDLGLAIAQQLHGPIEQGIDVVGLLDEYLAPGSRIVTSAAEHSADGAPSFMVVGHPRDAQALAQQYGCELLLVVLASLSWESQHWLAEVGSMPDPGLEVRLAPTQYDLTAVGVESAPLGHIPLLRLQPARIVGFEAMLRSTVDTLLAALLLTIAAPAVAWLILEARRRGVRPILEHRQVVGQGGRPVFLNVLHPRVSGNLLLRGVPALFAVLRGDLALVGPRPVLLEQRTAYQEWIRLVTAVRPGLTGPWRLTSPSAANEQQILADVWWVRNWTIWQHLFVLVQTARRTLGPTRDHRELVRWEVHPPDVRDVGLRVPLEV